MNRTHKSFRKRTIGAHTSSPALENTDKSIKNSENDIYNLVVRAALVPITGALLYSGAYITGLSYHQTYLSEYGVPLDLFQKQPNDYFLYAYIAILTALTNILDLITNYKTWLVLIALVATTLIYILILTLIAKSKSFQRKLNSINKRKKTSIALAIILLSTSIPGIILSIPLCTTFVLTLPAFLGSYSGKIVASKEKESFELGCKPKNNSREYCYSIKDKYSTIKSGHIIAISATHIAIFNKNKSYIYLLAGKSIETSPQIEGN